jgi:hypothetical protein
MSKDGGKEEEGNGVWEMVHPFCLPEWLRVFRSGYVGSRRQCGIRKAMSNDYSMTQVRWAMMPAENGCNGHISRNILSVDQTGLRAFRSGY